MESIGGYLKKERELQNLSLTVVSESIRVREQFLKAIEEDRYDLLPHSLYTKGYLGAYARFLGLDPREVILSYQNHLKGPGSAVPQKLHEPTLHKPLIILKAEKRPMLFSSRAIVACFLLALLALYGFYEASRSYFLPSDKESILIQGKDEARRAVEAIQKEILMVGETEARDVIPMEASPYEVIDVIIGKAVELESGRSILKERCSEFSCDNQRAYFFTRIKAPRKGKVTHLWYRDGKEFQRVEIDVKPPAWTVYSYLTLRPGYAGSWMAEVRDGGTILSNISFRAIEAKAF